MLNLKKPLRHKAKGVIYHYVGTIPDGDHVLACKFNDGYWSLHMCKDQQLDDEFENVVLPEYLWANVYSHGSYSIWSDGGFGQVTKTLDDLDAAYRAAQMVRPDYVRIGVIKLTLMEGKLTNVELVDHHAL